jgi:two-component system LytT family response regulator
MILRAIIIDDEPKGIHALKLIIQDFIKDVKVVASSTRASEAIDLIGDYAPDIVFLDIDMPEMNGFELLERLSVKNFSLVFVTAHKQYALKALKSNAADYLLKPIDHRELQKTIHRIRSNTHAAGAIPPLSAMTDPSSRQRLLVNLRSAVESVELEEIIYLESRSNYTHIHLMNGTTIVASKKLKHFENELVTPNSHFCRVHNSFIINLHKVLRYLKSERCIVLVNKIHIPLSGQKKGFFYSWLNP